MSAKRRAGVQITQDTDFDRDEEPREESGLASAEEMAKRRKLKRPDAWQKTEQSVPAASNPFAGINLLAPAPAPPANSTKPVETGTASSEKTEPAKGSEEDKTDGKEASAQSPPPATSPAAQTIRSPTSAAAFSLASTPSVASSFSTIFGEQMTPSVAAGGTTAAPASTAAAGASFTMPALASIPPFSFKPAGGASFNFGTGSFGSLAASGSGFGSLTGASFGAAGTTGGFAAASSAFNFGSMPGGNFPSLSSVFQKSSGNGAMFSSTPSSSSGAGEGATGSGEGGPSGAGEDQTKFKMTEEPVKTGEEEDDNVFEAPAATLYQFEGGWKSRGKGTLRVNKFAEGTRGRLVMKGHKDLHLLLNANIWKGMSFTKMDGTAHGLSFACVNYAGQSAAKDGKDETKDATQTYAVKFNSKGGASQLEEFLERIAELADEMEKGPAEKGEGEEAGKEANEEGEAEKEEKEKHSEGEAVGEETEETGLESIV